MIRLDTNFSAAKASGIIFGNQILAGFAGD
jgi:hypothetical protein